MPHVLPLATSYVQNFFMEKQKRKKKRTKMNEKRTLCKSAKRKKLLTIAQNCLTALFPIVRRVTHGIAGEK